MGGTDKIIFGAGITADDLLLKQDGNHLVIALKDGDKAALDCADYIYVREFFSNGNFGRGTMETVEFANGSSVTRQDLVNLMLTQFTDAG
jgi:carbamate kinase